MALDKLTKVQSVGISSFIQVVGVVTATQGFVGDVTGTTSNASGATGDFSIADKIVHTGDTNTAIRFPAADTITAETGGSERFRVTSAGKVGIGTDNPSKTLTLFGASSSSFRISKSGVLAYDHTFDGSSYTIANNNGSAGIPIIIGTKTAGGEALRIDSSGRTGIQGAPTRALLEVRASGGSNTMLTALWGANEGTTAGTLTDNTDKAVRMGIQHYDTDALPYAFLVGSSTSSANNLTFGGGTSLMNAATELVFRTASNTTTTAGTERLRITSIGGVIIGSGNNDSSMSEFGSNTGGLTIDDAGGSNTGLRLSHGNDDTYLVQSSNSNFYISQYGAGAMIFGVGSSGNERLRIASDGNVGINNTAPSDKLHVGGNIRFGTNTTYYGIIEHEAGVTGANIYTSKDTGGHIFKTGTTPAEVVRIQNGGGISFGGDTAVANALNDYEEGNFIPNYGSGISSPSYTGTGGHYTKIGNLVTFTIRIRATGTNSSAQLKIAGLPFPSNAHNEGSVSFGYMDNLNGNNGFTGHIPENSSEIHFYNFTGSNLNGNSGNGVSGRTLHLRGFYYTNS